MNRTSLDEINEDIERQMVQAELDDLEMECKLRGYHQTNDSKWTRDAGSRCIDCHHQLHRKRTALAVMIVQ